MKKFNRKKFYLNKRTAKFFDELGYMLGPGAGFQPSTTEVINYVLGMMQDIEEESGMTAQRMLLELQELNQEGFNIQDVNVRMTKWQAFKGFFGFIVKAKLMPAQKMRNMFTRNMINSLDHIESIGMFSTKNRSCKK